MQLTSAEIGRIVRGAVEGSGAVVLTGAEVDSRRVRDGDLFVALRGSRSDGHAFVDQALLVAGAALVRYDAELEAIPRDRALIRVEDPLRSYWALAHHERRRQGWRVAAVTGSVGKTTTKDMLAAILASRLSVGATSGNRNSTLGLPSEVLSQNAPVEVFVAETGMSSFGELDTLGEILEPELVLYTTLAPVHTEFFPDFAGIVRAKAELLAHLRRSGTLVVNAADPHQQGFPGKTDAAVLRYGADGADGCIEDLEDRGLCGSRFTLRLPSGSAVVELALAGVHQAQNLLAAATAGHAFGVGPDAVAEVALTLEPAARRGRVHRLAGGVTVVDDSYNASPPAMARLLALLRGAPGRRVAVLGEMFELGEGSADAHREVGRLAADSCDVLIAVGGADADCLADAAVAAGMSRAAVHRAAAADAAATVLTDLLEDGDVVLVKASRGVGLDRTVDAVLHVGGA